MRSSIVGLASLAAAVASFALLVGCASAPDAPAAHTFAGSETADGGPGPSSGPGAEGGAQATSHCDGGACTDAGSTPVGTDPTGDAAAVGCVENNACKTARDIGALAGDLGTDTLSYEGTGPIWLKVRVSETDFSIIGHPMRLTLTLVSPTGENFDLYAYGDPNTDQIECTNLMGKSTTLETDTVSLQWGEGLVANDADDSRTISIEVRNVSGTCGSSDKWTLVLQGNH